MVAGLFWFKALRIFDSERSSKAGATADAEPGKLEKAKALRFKQLIIIALRVKIIGVENTAEKMKIK